MIFADKLIRLRKKNGWSQEELAEKMAVSRQAVSKWEGAQSVPDISKILQLSYLFGVSTDYLLKDEIENEELCDEVEPCLRKISLEDAHRYIDISKKNAVKNAISVFLFVICPLPLLLFGVSAEQGLLPLSEDAGGIIGLILLLVIVTVATCILVKCSANPFAFVEKEPFDIEYGVEGFVSQKRKEYEKDETKSTVAGVAFCICSAIPLFCAGLFESDMLGVLMFCIMLFLAAIGTAIAVNSNTYTGAMDRILKTGDFSPEKTKEVSVKSAIYTIYWLIVTAIFLLCGFITSDWGFVAPIVWSVGGVLFAVVVTLTNLFVKKDNEK